MSEETLQAVPASKEPDAYRAGRHGQIAQVFRAEGIARVIGQCTVTHKEYSVEVPLDGFIKWQQGGYIQDCLPTTPPEQREFLISGTSPEGFNQLFGTGEDEESGDGIAAD